MVSGSGYYYRTNQEKGFMYLDYRYVNDKYDIIADVYIARGDLHDLILYIENIYSIKISIEMIIKNSMIENSAKFVLI